MLVVVTKKHVADVAQEKSGAAPSAERLTPDISHRGDHMLLVSQQQTFFL